MLILASLPPMDGRKGFSGSSLPCTDADHTYGTYDTLKKSEIEKFKYKDRKIPITS